MHHLSVTGVEHLSLSGKFSSSFNIKVMELNDLELKDDIRIHNGTFVIM